jgi:hypothetical protein
MQQRETFVLKLTLAEDQHDQYFSATLQSANSGNRVVFGSMDLLTEYLKIWQVRAKAELKDDQSKPPSQINKS